MKSGYGKETSFLSDYSLDGTMTATNEEEEAVKLALDMRIQLLETLVGLDTLAASKNRQSATTSGSITRRGQIALAEIYNAVEKAGSESVKRFLDSCALACR
jgi:hypothetical protein